MLFKKNINNEQNNSQYRKHGDYTLIILIIFFIIVIFAGITIYNNSIKGKCNSFEKNAIETGFKFAVNNNLLPSYESDSVKINLDAVMDWENKFRNSSCTGSLTIIKTDIGYVKQLNLENCNKCTTSKKSIVKTSDKFEEKYNITKVDVVYNYKNRQINYTPWTEYYESSKISPTPQNNNIYMPYDQENYPVMPEGSILINYEVDKKTFYSYRDASWKFYKIANNSYSTFSSTKPVNYAYKDEKTEITTEPSEWSTSYPEEKEYRNIKTTTGYKYYYEDKSGTKIYYNNGNFTAEITDETLKKLYNKKDNETIKMYSYTDTLWKWYNGNARQYSSYMKEANKTYPYKDSDLIKYNNWSKWSEISSINSSNDSYREERTDIHSRYRAKYAYDSEEVLSEYMPKNDFEVATGRTLQDLQNDENINLLIKYTYHYSK